MNSCQLGGVESVTVQACGRRLDCDHVRRPSAIGWWVPKNGWWLKKTNRPWLSKRITKERLIQPILLMYANVVLCVFIQFRYSSSTYSSYTETGTTKVSHGFTCLFGVVSSFKQPPMVSSEQFNWQTKQTVGTNQPTNDWKSNRSFGARHPWVFGGNFCGYFFLLEIPNS